jgi:uncharacterized beta-barrel protein YwiB (DUF1934 family)
MLYQKNEPKKEISLQIKTLINTNSEEEATEKKLEKLLAHLCADEGQANNPIDLLSDDENVETVELCTEATIETAENGQIEVSYKENEDDPQMLTLSKIIFRPEDPGLVVMTKRGGINTALSFEEGRTHICTYDTPFMPFKVYVTSDKVDNRLLSVGKLNMDYTLNINDTPPQHFVISVTAKTNSEDPFKNLFDGAES